MRNARVLQHANEYKEAALAASTAARLFRLIVDGDELNQVSVCVYACVCVCVFIYIVIRSVCMCLSPHC